MEVRVLSITYNGNDHLVRVGFFESPEPAATQYHTKTYFLKPGQKLEDLYPTFKDDLEDYEKGMAEAEELSKNITGNDAIDLRGVESARVLSKRKFEAQAKKDQEEREAKEKERKEREAEESSEGENIES